MAAESGFGAASGDGRPEAQGRAGRGRAVAQQNRAVATRYDKLAVNYGATVLVAAINEWL